MSALRTLVWVIWAAFGLYWLIAATTAKHGSRGVRTWLPGILIVIAFVLVRVVRTRTLDVHSRVLQVVGVGLLLIGLSFAVWARIHIGRNWGMPMTRKDQPELVTSGPYRFVRHPIYSGFLLALLGTSLATNISLLIALAVLGVYAICSASVEERLLTASFPTEYPSYKEKTKMLIPFVL